jgi:hypothetical protein
MHSSNKSREAAWTLIIAAMMFIVPGTLFAQFGTGAPTNQEKVEDGPAPIRDLTGVWMRYVPDGEFRSNSTFTEVPPKLTKWGEQRFAANKNSNAGGFSLAETNDPVITRCYPPGVPRVYFHPYPFEFVHTPKDTIMLYEYDHTVRRIYTDGRDHPDPDLQVPLWMGHSIGRWADDTTFVVDTVGFNDRTWLDRSGIPHSEALHVTEAFHRVDRKTMELELTMEDPVALTEPWTAKLYFRLAPVTWELGEISCSGDYQDFSSFEDFLEN